MDSRCQPLQQGKESKQTDRQTEDVNLFSRVKGASRQTDRQKMRTSSAGQREKADRQTEDANLFNRVKGASRQTDRQTEDANLFSRVKGASRQTDRQTDGQQMPTSSAG